MIEKKFGIDFDSPGGALTLDQSEVCSDSLIEDGFSSRMHEDGWTISGEIYEDYYVWVNGFVASHPIYGKIRGDFESSIFADNEEGYKDFMKNHAPTAWDYGDI
jgi:hypothetical protein